MTAPSVLVARPPFCINDEWAIEKLVTETKKVFGNCLEFFQLWKGLRCVCMIQEVEDAGLGASGIAESLIRFLAGRDTLPSGYGL